MVIISVDCNSQDLVFNNYRGIEGIINPSFAGHFNGDWQVSLLSRQQWIRLNDKASSNFVNFEKQIYLSEEHFTIGGYLLAQKSGSINYSSNKLNLTLAYHKKIKNNYFHLGFQPFINNKYFNINNKTTPSQYDVEIGKFNPTLNNYENSIKSNIVFADFNFGLGWNATYGKWTPNLGLSIIDILKPNEQFTSQHSKRFSTKIIHGALSYNLNEKNTLNPYIHYFGKRTTQSFLFGADYAYNIQSTSSGFKSLRCGYQVNIKTHADAYVLTIGTDLLRYSFDLSFENYLSGVGEAAGGAIEIKITYKALNTKLKDYYIPCNRY